MWMLVFVQIFLIFISFPFSKQQNIFERQYLTKFYRYRIEFNNLKDIIVSDLVWLEVFYTFTCIFTFTFYKHFNAQLKNFSVKL